jgi:hypothetical protein
MVGAHAEATVHQRPVAATSPRSRDVTLAVWLEGKAYGKASFKKFVLHSVRT